MRSPLFDVLHAVFLFAVRGGRGGQGHPASAAAPGPDRLRTPRARWRCPFGRGGADQCPAVVFNVARHLRRHYTPGSVEVSRAFFPFTNGPSALAHFQHPYPVVHTNASQITSCFFTVPGGLERHRAGGPRSAQSRSAAGADRHDRRLGGAPQEPTWRRPPATPGPAAAKVGKLRTDSMPLDMMIGTAGCHDAPCGQSYRT